MLKWLRARLAPSVELIDKLERPTIHENLEMAIRVEEALAAAGAAARVATQQTDEAQRLFGNIRRELAIARAREAQRE